MSRRMLDRRIVGVYLLVVGTVPAVANDWSQFRGPKRDGHSHESGLLKEWPEGGPPLVWQVTDIGDGYSAPIAADGRVYIMGNNGPDNEFVQARDAKNGAIIWSHKIGKVGNPEQRPPYPGARSTPTLVGDRLYVFGSDGDLACLEAATGNAVWQKNVRKDFGGEYGEWAYSESPLVDGNVVVVTPGGAKATMLAVNKSNGEVIWEAPFEEADEAGYASVVVANIGGVKQYVQFLQKGLVGVDAATGKLLWRYEKTGANSPANIPTPVVKGDLVYSAAGRTGGGLVRIKAENGEFTPEEVYFEGNLPKAIGGTVLVDDYLYGTSSTLMCVEFATGDVKWQDRSIGAASVCYADGNLYLHGENGDVALVAATPEEYQEKGRFSPPGQPDRGDGKAWSYPAIADGKLYISDNGVLWCYDIAAK
jgi:outer membrane protein assembly factor BamB